MGLEQAWLSWFSVFLSWQCCWSPRVINCWPGNKASSLKAATREQMAHSCCMCSSQYTLYCNTKTIWIELMGHYEFSDGSSSGERAQALGSHPILQHWGWAERRKKDGCFFPFIVVGPRTHKGLWSSGVTGKICLLWLMKGRVGWQQQYCYDRFGSSNEGGRCEIAPVSSSIVPSFLPTASSLQLLLGLFVTWFTVVVNIEGTGEGRTHDSLDQ